MVVRRTVVLGLQGPCNQAVRVLYRAAFGDRSYLKIVCEAKGQLPGGDR